MNCSASGVLAAGVLSMVAATATWSMAPVPEPAESILPATDINRESNNPAKEAIRAREAQEKDRAKQAAQAQDSAATPAGPVSDNAKLVGSVEAALRNDPRTAKLGVAVQLDEQNLISLNGSVPSIESRSAVLDIAARVAGVARIRNHLVIAGKK